MKILLWVAIGLALAGAQDPKEPQRPTFKSSIEVVAVDVSVVDRATGLPIRDLRAADFTLLVDGKARRITSAEFIPAGTGDAAPPEAPLHYSSNTGAVGGRLIALVIDQGSLRAGTGKLAIDAAKRFVAGLNKADRVALHSIPGAGARIDFTSNHVMVRSLLDRVTGSAIQSAGPRKIGISEMLALERNDQAALVDLLDRECPAASGEELRLCRVQLANEARALAAVVRNATRDSLLALRELIDRLARVRAPKTIVYISEGMIVDRQFSDLSWVGPLAAKAQLSLYVLQIEPPMFDASSPRVSATRAADIELGQQGLNHLAGLARGDVFRINVTADSAFARISKELSAYYLLSFEAEPGDRDGQNHKIKIALPNRRDVLLRSRAEFSADAAQRTNTEEVLADTLRSPLLATDIPAKATTYNFWDTAAKKMRIVIAAELDRSTNPVGNVALTYALINSRGEVAATEWQPTVKAPVADDKTQTYIGAVLVPSDVYTLKLAVLDEAGKKGSVEHSFRGQLESAGQVKIGGLLLAEKPAPERPLRTSVGGEFFSDTLHGYLELYSEAPEQLKNTTVVIEVAQSHDSRALESTPADLQPAETPDSRIAEASVTIGLLPPGDYVVRAVVNVFGRKAGQIVRPFRIVKKQAGEPAK